MPPRQHRVIRPHLALPWLLLPGLVLAQSPERIGNPQPGLDERFGAALAASGRWLLVGAPDDDTAGGNEAGSVFVFELVDGRYVAHSRLTASDGAGGDGFGYALAIDGDTAVVGAWTDSLPAGSGAGSSYVFALTGADWTQVGKLTAPDGATGDAFGAALSLSGDVLLVGAPFDDLPSLADAGSAHLFLRSGDSWTFATKLVAPDATAFDRFGFAVATDVGNLLVGARDADNEAGVVYAYGRNGSSADFRDRLVPADRGASDRFGSALAVDGDQVLIGASGQAGASGANAGAAYVYQRVGNGWTQQAKLLAPGAPEARSGFSVALRGDVAVLGAPGATLGDCCQQGAADLFLRNGLGWRFERRLSPADGGTFDNLGSAMALGRGGAVLGAPTTNDRGTGQRDAGSAMQFPETWPMFRDGFDLNP